MYLNYTLNNPKYNCLLKVQHRLTLIDSLGHRVICRSLGFRAEGPIGRYCEIGPVELANSAQFSTCKPASQIHEHVYRLIYFLSGLISAPGTPSPPYIPLRPAFSSMRQPHGYRRHSRVSGPRSRCQPGVRSAGPPAAHALLGSRTRCVGGTTVAGATDGAHNGPRADTGTHSTYTAAT